MTAPSWLTDKAVKVLAAKNLPVVLVRHGTLWRRMTADEDTVRNRDRRTEGCLLCGGWVVPAPQETELRAAWERLESDCATPEYDGGGDEGYRPAHKVPDGFYYLEPEQIEYVGNLCLGKEARRVVTPPTLVPCEEAMLDWENYSNPIAAYMIIHNDAALVFHNSKTDEVYGETRMAE